MTVPANNDRLFVPLMAHVNGDSVIAMQKPSGHYFVIGTDSSRKVTKKEIEQITDLVTAWYDLQLSDWHLAEPEVFEACKERLFALSAVEIANVIP